VFWLAARGSIQLQLACRAISASADLSCSFFFSSVLVTECFDSWCVLHSCSNAEDKIKNSIKMCIFPQTENEKFYNVYNRRASFLNVKNAFFFVRHKGICDFRNKEDGVLCA